MRRWLIVAGVWAVAATALAVFALIQANQEDEAGREEAAGQIGRVERQLNDRIDTLEQRIEGLPSSEDVANLEDRLGRVEDDARAQPRTSSAWETESTISRAASTSSSGARPTRTPRSRPRPEPALSAGLERLLRRPVLVHAHDPAPSTRTA